jgi:hypothetical protein
MPLGVLESAESRPVSTAAEGSALLRAVAESLRREMEIDRLGRLRGAAKGSALLREVAESLRREMEIDRLGRLRGAAGVLELAGKESVVGEVLLVANWRAGEVRCLLQSPNTLG